jgi:hypothetical protein
MRHYLFFFLLSFLAACSGGANQTQEPVSTEKNETDTSETAKVPETVTPSEDTSAAAERTVKEASMPPPAQNEFTAGKVTYLIENGENERGASTVKVVGTDPVFSKEFPVAGRISESFLLDLNKDGFSEFYFTVTTSNGASELKGIASYRDRSAGEIYVKDENPAWQPGASHIFVENGALYRSFSKSEGTEQKLKYELKKGETSFVLSPVKAGK